MRPPVYWRDAIGGLQLVIIAAGMLCLAGAAVVIGSPFLLASWCWRKARGRP